MIFIPIILFVVIQATAGVKYDKEAHGTHLNSQADNSNKPGIRF